MDDTIFGKIIRREVPANIVYEDDATLAFLDRAPERPGHTLIVPKKAARNVLDADEATFLAVMRTVHKLAPVLKKVTAAAGIKIAMNNEKAAGQDVFHMHAHLVPVPEDRPLLYPSKAVAEDQALAQMAEKIRENIS